MRSILVIAAVAFALPAAAQVAGTTEAVGSPATGAVTPPGTGPATTGNLPASTAGTGTIAGGINTNTASGTTATTGTNVGATGSSSSSDMSATTASARDQARLKKDKRTKPGVDAAAGVNQDPPANSGDLTNAQTPHR